MPHVNRKAEELSRSTSKAQHGVLSHSQLRACGFSDSSIRRRIAAGHLARILPGVYQPGGSTLTWHSRALAAALWPGIETAISGGSAAKLMGLPGFASAGIEISTLNHCHGRRILMSDGTPVRVRRVDDRLLDEIVEFDQIPCTTARRTLLDLAGMKDSRAEFALDTALDRSMVTVGDVWLLLDKEWMRGRRGVRIMRDLLVPRTSGRAPAESELELMMLRLLLDAGFPEPILQFPVELPSASIRIDLAYPRERLAIETDGYLWHMDRKSFEHDRIRDNELRSIGWDVLRFTWAVLRHAPGHVLAMLEPFRSRFVTEWAENAR